MKAGLDLGRMNNSSSREFHFACGESYPQYYYNPSSKLNFLLLSVLGMCLAIATSVTNGLLLISIVFNRRLRRGSNFLLLTLIIANLLQAFTTMPMFAIKTYALHLRQLQCSLAKIATVLGYSITQLKVTSIFIINFEQYLAVVYPYKHRIWLPTYRKLYAALLAICSSYSAFAFLSLVIFVQIWVVCLSISVLFIVSVFSCVFYFNGRITKEVKKSALKIRHSNPIEAKRIIERGKSTKVTLFVVLSFIICYVPFTCYTVFEVAHGITRFTVTYLQLWKDFLTLWNSLLSPIVCFWKLSALRRGICNVHRRLGVGSIEGSIQKRDRCDTRTTTNTVAHQPDSSAYDNRQNPL